MSRAGITSKRTRILYWPSAPGPRTVTYLFSCLRLPASSASLLLPAGQLLVEEVLYFPDHLHSVLLERDRMCALANDDMPLIRRIDELGENFLRHVKRRILVPFRENQKCRNAESSQVPRLICLRPNIRRHP